MHPRIFGPVRTARVFAGTLLVVTALWALGACTPTYNWRDLRPAGTPLQALMPCKPELAERTLPLAGVPTQMHMHSCDTGGQTFVVGWASVAEEAGVTEVLAGWRAGSLAAIRVAPGTAAEASADWPATVQGAQQVQGLQATGQNLQGNAVQMRAAYFSKGTQVFQAAVYGPTLSEEALTTFFDGLRLQ